MAAIDNPPDVPDRRLGIEIRSIDWIPFHERHGTIGSQVRFWFIGNFLILTVSIGFIGPSLGLSLGWSILAATGNVLGAVFMALHASQGPQLGLPQMIQTRAQLGYRGVIIALAATLFVFLGFNILDTILLGSGLNSVFGWNKIVVGIAAGGSAALLAIFGHDYLHKIFTIVFWFSVPIFSILFVGIAVGAAGGTPAAATGFSIVAFMAQFAAACSYNIAFAPYVSDFSRYLPRETPTWKVVLAVFGGAGGSGFIMIVLGSWLASSLGATDALVGVQTAGDNIIHGLGTVLVVVSVIALVATMGMSAYSAHLTAITAVDCFRKVVPTKQIRIITIVVLVIVWTTIGLSLPGSYLTSVNDFLVIMLYLLIPWSALNLVDYFLVRKAHYSIVDLFNPAGIYGMWSWRGLLAYIVGLLSMIPFAVTSFYKGVVVQAVGGVDIAWLVGLVVSGALYFAVALSLRTDDEQSAINTSEAQLAQADRGDATLISGAPTDPAPR
jgi:nucleobase:cation symporter-1, NCS1 family